MKKMINKNTKILLINPKCEREIVYNHFPLGLIYITQTLIDEGYQNIQILDFSVHTFKEEELIKLIDKERFGIVGLTGLITAYPQIKSYSKIIKETYPETKIVLGGPAGTAFPEVVLKNTCVDIVVVGEGERTVRELFNAIFDGGNLEDVKGICYLDGEKDFNKTHPRDLIGDLDSIPFPNRDLFLPNIIRYFKVLKPIGFFNYCSLRLAEYLGH